MAYSGRNYDAASAAADRTIIGLAAVMYNIHRQQLAQMEQMQTQHTIDTYRLRGVPEERIQRALRDRDQYLAWVAEADRLYQIIHWPLYRRVLRSLVSLAAGAGALDMGYGVSHSSSLSQEFLGAIVAFALLVLARWVAVPLMYFKEVGEATQKQLTPLLAAIATAEANGVPQLYIP